MCSDLTEAAMVFLVGMWHLTEGQESEAQLGHEHQAGEPAVQVIDISIHCPPVRQHADSLGIPTFSPATPAAKSPAVLNTISCIQQAASTKIRQLQPKTQTASLATPAAALLQASSGLRRTQPFSNTYMLVLTDNLKQPTLQPDTTRLTCNTSCSTL